MTGFLKSCLSWRIEYFKKIIFEGRRFRGGSDEKMRRMWLGLEIALAAFLPSLKSFGFVSFTLNFNLIKHVIVKDTVFFCCDSKTVYFYISFFSMLLVNKKCASYFRREPANENSFKKSLISNFYHHQSNLSRVHVLNLALPSLHGG